MRDYRDGLEVFIQEMKKSTVYTEYLLQRDNLRKYPELKKQVDEYRYRVLMMQQQTQPDQIFDVTDQFLKESESFRENPVVYDFLAAELAFCRMMQNIHMRVVDEAAMDFE